MTLALTWVVSLGVAIPPTLGLGLYHHYSGWAGCILMDYRDAADMAYVICLFTVTFFLPELIMTYTYVRILTSVRHNARRVQSLPSNLTLTEAARLGLAAMARTGRVDMGFRTRAFKTVLILFLSFAVCWTPHAVTLITFNLTRSSPHNHVAGNVVTWIGYLNCAVNPIIYFWRIRKFRDACRDILPHPRTLLPALPSRTQRRVFPAAAYECELDHTQTSI